MLLHFRSLLGHFVREVVLLAYGFGLSQLEYEPNPFEQMADTLQRSFENGDWPQHLVRDIEEQTDTIWTEVAPIVQGGSCI